MKQEARTWRDPAFAMIQRSLLSAVWIEDQRGQGLVELAIVGLALVLILAGVMDLGRAYFAYVAVADAAAEGASYGATFPDSSEGEIKDHIVGASGGLVSIDPDMVSVISDTHTITVTVTYIHSLLTPFIQTLVGGDDTIPLRQQAVQRVLD